MSRSNPLLLVVLALAMPALAQVASPSLVQTRANFVAYSGMFAPGTAASAVLAAPSQTGSNPNPPSPFDSPVINANGEVFFRSRMTGNIATTNERALFRGHTAADLQMVIRGGDAAPGLPAGITLNTATAQGLNGTVRMSSTGIMMFASAMSGTGLTTSNDSAFFGGLPGSLAPFFREGDPAPGTAGATLSSSFSSMSQQSTGCNESGYILFQSATAGGDTITSGTTANNSGWFTGLPGNLQLMQRKGDLVLGGTVGISALGFISQMNSLGQVLHDETLSTSLGTTPATAANDKTLWIYNQGVGNTLILREGDPAPGTGGGTFSLASNGWTVNTGSNTFNNNGNTVISADISGGNVVAGLTDRALYIGGISGWTMAMRRGDVAPGTGGATFDVVSNASLNINNGDEIAFEASLLGGGTTTTNDTGIWKGTANNFVKIMQEGDPAPGTAGAVFGNQTGLFMIMNERGQIVFSASLVGGDVVPVSGNGNATYAYDPIVGLQLVARGNDVITLPDNTTKNIGSFGSGIQFNNGAANPLSFNADGTICSAVNFPTTSGGGGAIVTIRLGSISGVPSHISAAAGGVHTMYLDAGVPRAGALYVLAGTASGTQPGFQVGAFTIPLNIDPYFQLTIQFANLPPFGNTFSTLDGFGRSVATLTVPAGIPGLAGIVLHHAFATIDGFGQPSFASDVTRLELVP